MKWIVMYVIVNTFVAPCPIPSPSYDEFGVRTNSDYNTFAITCFDTTKERHEKLFDTLEEAESFVKRGKEKYSGESLIHLPGTIVIEDWKIVQKD